MRNLMVFQLFQKAEEASKEMKKNKKKRASTASTGSSTASASPKGDPTSVRDSVTSESPRPKSISPIVEKVDSEVQFKVRHAAVDEVEKPLPRFSPEKREAETIDVSGERDVVLVPIDIRDSLKRRLDEDHVRILCSQIRNKCRLIF